MFKVNNKATKTTSWRRFGGFIVNFKHISHLYSSISIVNFKQVNVGWDDDDFVILMVNAYLSQLLKYQDL